MSEKSGLDLLNDLINKVDLLTKRFEVFEQNTKEILNRMNKEKRGQDLKEASAPPVAPGMVPSFPKNKTTPNTTTSSSGNMITIDVSNLNPNPIRVQSKIKSKDNKPISGVSVKIFKGEELVKETKTNKAGSWLCMLPTGKYKAVCLNETDDENLYINETNEFEVLPTQNKTLNVPRQKQ